MLTFEPVLRSERYMLLTCYVLHGHHKIDINRRVSLIILEDDERESEGRVFRVSAVCDSNTLLTSKLIILFLQPIVPS